MLLVGSARNERGGCLWIQQTRGHGQRRGAEHGDPTRRARDCRERVEGALACGGEDVWRAWKKRLQKSIFLIFIKKAGTRGDFSDTFAGTGCLLCSGRLP